MTTRFSTATHNKILVKDEDFVMYNTSLCSDKFFHGPKCCCKNGFIKDDLSFLEVYSCI